MPRTTKNLKREPNVLYLDANVFIYSAINTEEPGDKARLLLEKIQQGQESAVTSVLTCDEVFWVIKKHSVVLALETFEAMLNFPNLEIVDATKELALSALRLIKELHLAPRDALHAATALEQKVDCMVTSDAHFNRVKELTVTKSIAGQHQLEKSATTNQQPKPDAETKTQLPTKSAER
jgi:predicted nucleic acid-binding protein